MALLIKNELSAMARRFGQVLKLYQSHLFQIRKFIGRTNSSWVLFRIFSSVFILLPDLAAANAQLNSNILRLPKIEPELSMAPMFVGRWDFIPVIAPDSMPSKVRVAPNGDVWIASDGGILRRTTSGNALLVDNWADGRDEALPLIISHDMIVVGDDGVLVSTIWREIFFASPKGLVELNTRGVRGAYSFSALPDGRLAIGLDDWRIPDNFVDRMSSAIGLPVMTVTVAHDSNLPPTLYHGSNA